MDLLFFRPIILVPFIFIYIIVNAIYYRKKRTTIIQQIINFSFYIYMLLLVSSNLLPLPISESYIQMLTEQGAESQNKFVPLSEIKQILNSHSISIVIMQFADNLLLLLPLGFYAPLVLKRFNNLKSILLLAFITSTGIETSKLFISTIINFTYFGFTTDNILLNTTGAIFGFLLLKLISPLLQYFTKQYKISNSQNIGFHKGEY